MTDVSRRVLATVILAAGVFLTAKTGWQHDMLGVVFSTATVAFSVIALAAALVGDRERALLVLHLEHAADLERYSEALQAKNELYEAYTTVMGARQ